MPYKGYESLEIFSSLQILIFDINHYVKIYISEILIIIEFILDSTSQTSYVYYQQINLLAYNDRIPKRNIRSNDVNTRIAFD